MDDLVTRERLLLASFKNEGAEPDLIRYDVFISRDYVVGEGLLAESTAVLGMASFVSLLKYVLFMYSVCLSFSIEFRFH